MVRPPPLLELPEEPEEPLTPEEPLLPDVVGEVELLDGLLLEVLGLAGVLRVRPVTLPVLLLLEELVVDEPTEQAKRVGSWMGCSGCKGGACRAGDKVWESGRQPAWCLWRRLLVLIVPRRTCHFLQWRPQQRAATMGSGL